MHRTARGRLGTLCATRTLCAAVAALAAAAAWLGAPSRVTADRASRSAQPEGLQENPPGVHALVNARIFVSPGKRIEKGTVVVRDGVIEAVGNEVKPPADARVWDLAGKTIYPGLIDAYGELTEPAAPPAGGVEGSGGGGAPGGGPGGGELLRPAGPTVVGGAPYWNPRVTPQVRAADAYRADPEANKKLRSQGIVARLVAPNRQIVKGTSAAVSTNDGDPAQLVLRPDVAMHVRLSPPPSRQGEERAYPNSPMGAYALVRQAILDARWYAKARGAWELDRSLARPEQNDALEALGPTASGKLPLFVDAPDELYALRADRLAREFDLPAIVRGSGQEYRRLAAVTAGKRAVVVPVNFARPPAVAAPEQAMAVSLDELMDWDLQPENPARLDKAGVKLALTSHGLRDRAGFLPAVRKAVKRGLEKDSALRALTTTPAELLGIGKTHGTIEKGRSASLVVTDGDLLADKTLVLETWVDGKRHEVTPSLSPDPRGTWVVAWGEGDGAADGGAADGGAGKPRELRVTGTPTKLAGKFAMTGGPSTRRAGPATGPATRPADVELANVTYAPGQISFTFKGERLGLKGGVSQVSAAVIGDAWTGRLIRPDGTSIPLTAKRAAADAADKKDEAGDDDPPDGEAAKPKADGEVAADDAPRPAGRAAGAKRDDPTTRPASFDVTYPLGAFGRATRPAQAKSVLFRNATVWTNGPEGKLDGASVLVADGKITGVYGPGTKVELPAGTDVVDCSGKHLTAGIIDCHSHIATDGGINESGRAVTCNVRVGDFVDPDDISIYRQLAGGVTASNILHGSANPIGGQNQVVKLRWGAGPEQMKLDAAPPGVKFALGENVKQSSSERSTRYPQTRLGVEQIVRDRFRAAREYRAAHDRAKAPGPQGVPPRVDLELEALAEIVANERQIHCHSYRQDEILAFLRVCEEFGVKVNTLQHILEGYKVADAIAKHGAAASSFSDWWAYKFEVYDAIPYNGQILRDAGVLVSFNSDDAELARRLNLEAAKAVKYGKVPEEEALKFVTLNPARQLGIDKRVGSIEVGKDADLVVWSGPPLSTLSRCEQTWVDGRRYFDRTEDQEMQKRDAERRAKLIQKALAAAPATPAAAGGEDKPEPRERDRWTREDLFCGCRVEGGK